MSRGIRRFFVACIVLATASAGANAGRGKRDVKYRFATGTAAHVAIAKQGRRLADADDTSHAISRRGALVSLHDGHARPARYAALVSLQPSAEFVWAHDVKVTDGNVHVLAESLDADRNPSPFALNTGHASAQQGDHFFVQSLDENGRRIPLRTFTLDSIARPHFAMHQRSPGFMSALRDYRLPTALVPLPESEFLVGVRILGMSSLPGVEVYRVRPGLDGVAERVSDFGHLGRIVIDSIDTINGMALANDGQTAWLYAHGNKITHGGCLQCARIDVGTGDTKLVLNQKFQTIGGMVAAGLDPGNEKLYAIRRTDHGQSQLVFERYDVSADATGDFEERTPFPETELDSWETIDLIPNIYGGMSAVGRSSARGKLDQQLFYEFDQTLRLVNRLELPLVFSSENRRAEVNDDWALWQNE